MSDNSASPQVHADPARISQATRDPSRWRRWLQSRFLSRLVSPGELARRRQTHDQALQAESPPVLRFFHQPGDPHSELALQAVQPMARRYGLKPVVYRVPAPSGANNPEPELLPLMARHDAALIAPHYGLEMTADPAALGLECRPEEEGRRVRRELGHYGVAMFHVGGEWYWGVDRLCHLEKRLRALGMDQTPDEPDLFPRFSEEAIAGSGAGLTLECYASLRSPYTAIGWPRIRGFCEASGTRLDLKPVLPMVMRGAPISRVKGFYIFNDVAREAALYGQAFGSYYEPIGEPIRRAYRILPEVRAAGRELEFFDSFLSAAFTEGINTASRRGFRRVLRRAGLPADLYRVAVGDRPLPRELDDNREAMYAMPSWGVPTFRLLDETGKELVHAFGQDRLWLIARVIAQHRARVVS